MIIHIELERNINDPQPKKWMNKKINKIETPHKKWSRYETIKQANRKHHWNGREHQLK